MILPAPPPTPPTPFTLTISSNFYAPNVRSLATAAGWNGTQPLIVNITAALIGALDFGSAAFPQGCTVNVSAATRIGGAPGGVALTTRTFITISSLGFISGGGGTGGSGTSVTNFNVHNKFGGGASGGTGGSGIGVLNSAALQSANPGTAGTRVDLIDGITGISGWARGGNGGRGGEWGLRGGPGDSFTKSSNATINATITPKTNRAAGAAVDGDSYITWAALGTIQGARIN